MAKMSRIDYAIRSWLKQNISYIIISIIIIIIGFLIHATDKQKLNNKVYEQYVQIKSLEETIDNLERGRQWKIKN